MDMPALLVIGHVNKVIQNNFCSPNPWRLHMKLDFRLAKKISSPERVPAHIEFPGFMSTRMNKINSTVASLSHCD